MTDNVVIANDSYRMIESIYDTSRRGEKSLQPRDIRKTTTNNDPNDGKNISTKFHHRRAACALWSLSWLAYAVFDLR